MNQQKGCNSASVDVKSLSAPLEFEFSKRSSPNRFLKGAMSERLSSYAPSGDSNEKGVPSPELANLYRIWGKGNIGLILTGNIMVDVEHMEAAGNAAIPLNSPFHGQRFDAFRNFADSGKQNGGLMIGQINHPGRQCQATMQKDPVSASDIQLETAVMGMRFARPHPASLGEIDHITRAFVHAAVYLEKAGFDGIEIHAAHGYLIAQFLSPSTNKRQDEYGVNLRGRSKLLLDIVSGIRKTVSSTFIVGVKLNSVEFQTGGIRTEEIVDLCLSLEAAQVDFVELSGGTYEAMGFTHRNESTRKREAYFLEFAKTIVPALHKTKIYLTGGFRTAGAIVSALGTVNGIGLGRPLCQKPSLCDEILSNAVTGAPKLLIDENNTSLTNAAAVLQMRKLGNGEQNFDLTRESDVKAVLEELSSTQKSSAQKRSDKGLTANL